MRTFIATHRNDIDLSAMYKPLEDVFIQIGEGKDGGKDDPVFTLKKAEEQVIENYLEARDMALVWGKSNVDVNGKPKIYESETGRPIISSDGLIAQLERFATKFVFSKLTVAYFQKALATLVAKSTSCSVSFLTVLEFSNVALLLPWVRFISSAFFFFNAIVNCLFS